MSTFPTLPNEIVLSQEASLEAAEGSVAAGGAVQVRVSPGEEESLAAEPELLCALRRDLVRTQELAGKESRQETERVCPDPAEDQAGAPDPAMLRQRAQEAAIREMVAGYPIEVMAGAIAEYDPAIAGLIVGIARKESSWGEHVPTKNGTDCHNYWGYKGAGSRGTGMGYGCFATPEEGVHAIAERLEKLVAKRESSEPARLVTAWKCGSSCAGHSDESVRKWVSDVQKYYAQLAYAEAPADLR